MSQENIETLRQAYQRFGEGDVGAILEVMHPAVQWDATAALVHKGVYHGHDGVRDYLERLSDVWDEFELVADDFVDAGDRMIVGGYIRGVDKARGASVKAPFVHVVEMREGRVVKIQIAVDRASALQAIEQAPG